jgi:hypothetical protein
MGLAALTIDILLARLLWPVPRVRLETARALAALIKSGDRHAADRLLAWISRRKFESEVILGLNIIEAFDLGSYFNFTDVRNSVNAASHLSDWLMKANFAQTDGLFPFRYSYAPMPRAQLPERVRRTFSAFNGVPQMFRSHLSHLEEQSGLPFLKRWQHEWEWLQADELRGQGDPSYFFHGNREITGQFDFADRETYVSAYLRTLAFAAIEWGLPHSMAEQHSRAALTLNRGLAGVEPVERPKWSDGILPGDRDLKSVASAIWAAASSDLPPHQRLAGLRAVEVAETGYAVFEFDVAAGTAASLSGSEAPLGGRWSYLENPARYEGGFYSRPDAEEDARARMLCGTAMTFDVGRGLVDLVPKVHLPSPHAAHPTLELACLPDRIETQVAGSPVAFWQHWYADWEPAYPQEVRSLVGYRTLVDGNFLDAFCKRTSLKTGVWCEVKLGIRQYSYTEFESQTAGFWIDLPC